MKRKSRTRHSRKPARAKTVRQKTAQAKPVRQKTAREYELTTKRRGELSELAFIFKAVSLGFHVSKPYGDSERYDFILDAGPRLWRVQIKSTTTMICGLYRINAYRRTNHGAVPYQPGEIDFLIAHVIPEDAWFILPIALIQDRTSVLFPPRRHPRPRAHFGAYREAWQLLRNP
jgi:hypothetical protein